MPGFQEIIVIGVIVLLVLLILGGTKRIKSLGSDFANTIKSFRKTMDEDKEDKEDK